MILPILEGYFEDYLGEKVIKQLSPFQLAPTLTQRQATKDAGKIALVLVDVSSTNQLQQLLLTVWIS